MCRHLAYLGATVTLAELLLDPAALAAAAVLGAASPAARHRERRRLRRRLVRAGPSRAGALSTGPADLEPTPRSPRLAPTVSSGCVLAAVRSATPGFGPDESCAAPFTAQRWLFSHNGRLADWPAARKALADRTYDIAEASAPVDSALLFGLAAARWAGRRPAGHRAASTPSARSQAVGGGRLNLLATDGTAIAATCVGEPLFVRRARGRRRGGLRAVRRRPPVDRGARRHRPVTPTTTA